MSLPCINLTIIPQPVQPCPQQYVLLQIVIAVMHLGRYAVGSETLSVLVSFQILLLWIKIQYFARYSHLVVFAAAAWCCRHCCPDCAFAQLWTSHLDY